MQFDTSGVKGKDDLTKVEIIEPGSYHVRVSEIDYSMTKSESIVTKFEILAGTNSGQKGKTITEYFSVKPGAQKKLFQFLCSVGLMTESDFGRRDFDPDLDEAVDRELIVTVEENVYKDKTGKEKKNARVAWGGFFDVEDPAVKDVPRGGDDDTGADEGYTTEGVASSSAGQKDEWASM